VGSRHSHRGPGGQCAPALLRLSPIYLHPTPGTSYRPSVTISPRAISCFFDNIYSNSDMSQPSPSSSFQSLFNAALQDYAEQTGTRLDDHPFAQQLESCNSVCSISSVLQEHARRFHECRGEDGKIMKSLKCTVDVLYGLSRSTLGEGISLVCPKSLIYRFLPLILVCIP
jgi:hypothetical protein